MLIGHSAGAHLSALTTLFLVDEKEELFIEASKQRNVIQAIRGVIGKDHRVVHLQVVTMFLLQKMSVLFEVF